MEVPLNILHNYVGLPVLLGLSVDSLLRYRKTNNSTSLFFGWGCFAAAIATAFFGLPALFTHDSYLLSVGTFLGDIAYPVAMFLFWQISLRAATSKPRLILFVNTILGALTIALIFEAIFRNLTPPYGNRIIYDASGRTALEYTDTIFFTVFNAIDSLALIFLGIYFWRQGKNAPTRSQRVRILTVAPAFGIVTLAFLFGPLLPLDLQPIFHVVMLSMGFILAAIGGIVGLIIKRTEAVPS